MVAQALAKLGNSGKMCLSLVANESFDRQLKGFTVTDKALFLWALGKAQVVHFALCRMIIRDLACEEPSVLSRDVASASLWGLGLISRSLRESDWWAQRLLSALCATRPWIGAPPYEVANAAWALGQAAPPRDVAVETWESLVSTAQEMRDGVLSLHELCCLLSGLASCPPDVNAAHALMRRLAGEGCRLIHNGERLSAFDHRSIEETLSKVARPMPPELSELAESRHAVARGRPDNIRQKASFRLRCQSGSGCHELACLSGELCGAYQRKSMAEVDMSSLRGSVSPRANGNSLTAEVGEQRSSSASPPGKHDAHEAESAGVSPEVLGAQHGVSHMCSDECCPEILEASDDNIRLNAHCDYEGHCVRLKHTFIHIECTDPGGNGANCSICAISRRGTRSADSSPVREGMRDVLSLPPLGELMAPAPTSHALPPFPVVTQ